MPIPSSRTYVGIAKEVTPGTPVAPTASIPTGIPTAHDEISWLEDTALRGSQVDMYGLTPGPAWSTWDVSGDVFPDTIGYWLQSLLPDVTTTGAGPFTHTFAGLNTGKGQPTTYTITDYSGLGATSGARYYPGMQASELVLKFDATGKFTYDVKTTGNPSQLVPTSAPAKTFGTMRVTPGYLPTVTIGGSGLTTLQQGNLTLARQVTPIHVPDGTQTAVVTPSSLLNVTGGLLFVAEDETEILRYLNNTQPSLDIAFPAGVNASTAMTFHLTKIAYRTADPIRSKDFTEVQVAFQAIPNTTDIGASGGYSPMKVTVQNSSPAGTYK